MAAEIAGLSISAAGWRDIVQHVEACLPEEACGFLGGQEGHVDIVLPVENAEHSRDRFRMDPLGQLRGMQSLEDGGKALLAIYHSHPNGPSGLSSTDALEAAYPEAALVVVSPGREGWTPRAFIVRAGGFQEIALRVEESSSEQRPSRASGAPEDVA